MPKMFEINHTYETTSIWDSSRWHRITVASRTAKSIKTTEGETLRVIVENDREIVELSPFGMPFPFIGADSEGSEAEEATASRQSEI